MQVDVQTVQRFISTEQLAQLIESKPQGGLVVFQVIPQMEDSEAAKSFDSGHIAGARPFHLHMAKD